MLTAASVFPLGGVDTESLRAVLAGFGFTPVQVDLVTVGEVNGRALREAVAWYGRDDMDRFALAVCRWALNAPGNRGTARNLADFVIAHVEQPR